jgi:hypothetical protein
VVCRLECVFPCVSFMSFTRSYISLVFSSISGAVLGLEGVHNVPKLQYVWRRVIHASAFADEHNGSLNKLSLSIG